MIQRTIAKLIKETTKHFPVTLITGPRQVGKTTLLSSSDFSSYNFASIETYSSNYFLAKKEPLAFLDKYGSPLIIDEVQHVPELLPHLENLVNRDRLKGDQFANGRYIIVGSSKDALLSSSRVSLAGRMAVLKMGPLTLKELQNMEEKPFSFAIVDYLNQKTMSTESLYEQIFRGFMPGPNADKTMSISTFYESYIAIFIEKDLSSFLALKDKDGFINFLKLLATGVGQELIYDRLALDTGVSAPTIKSWIDKLETTGIIYRLHPYYENSFRKRLVKRSKLYFFDTGLVCHLLGIDSAKTLENSPLRGAIFENFVVQEIKTSFLNQGINIPLYYYRDFSGNEVDLLFIRGGQLYAIEIKSGDKDYSSFSKNFSFLNDSRMKVGGTAIVAPISSASVISGGTLLIPASLI